MIHLRRTVIATLLLVACASSQDAPVEKPLIRIAQVNSPGFLQERGGLVSVDYLIEVTNTAEVPITAERVELQTVGGGPYALRPAPIEMKKVIEPGKSELLEVSAWAYSSGGRAAATEPVTLRATIRFESPKGLFQVTKVERIRQN